VTLSLPPVPAGSAAARASTAPAATLAPPPPADLVGVITGPGGNCLDVGGLGLPGSSLTTRGCAGTLSQRWTVGADGTLRVNGMCATASGAAVDASGCGSGPSAQWRAGPGGTLVNLAAGRCLTDPDDGARTGGRMQLAACGGAGQGWRIP
jgi:hypothetical protein